MCRLSRPGPRVGGIKNGDLLERARGTVDVFVTMDRKLEKQHDLSVLSFGVVVIQARSNRMSDLLRLTEAARCSSANPSRSGRACASRSSVR
jgi:hypothetical protein